MVFSYKIFYFFSNCCQFSFVDKYRLNATCELMECHHTRCCGEYKTNLIFTLRFIVLKGEDGWSKGRKKSFLLKKIKEWYKAELEQRIMSHSSSCPSEFLGAVIFTYCVNRLINNCRMNCITFVSYAEGYVLILQAIGILINLIPLLLF